MCNFSAATHYHKQIDGAEMFATELLAQKQKLLSGAVTT
jgi:hypothetical protein